MLPDRVSNPVPLTYESGALPIALRGPAPPEKCLLIAFECRNLLLWAVAVRIMFLLDHAGNLKIR